MSEIVLKFDSNEEWTEAMTAVNARKLTSIIWEFDQKFRQLYKYEGKETIGTDECRKLLREIMDDNGITFEHEIFN